MANDKTRSLIGWIALSAAAGCAAALFGTGADIHVQSERALLIAAIWRHVGYGVVLSPLLIGGIAMFLVWRKAPAQNERSIIVRAAFWLFIITAAACLILAVTGPLVVWTHGSDLKVFDWFVIPNPLGERPALHQMLEESHVMLARTLPWVAALSGALALIASVRRK